MSINVLATAQDFVDIFPGAPSRTLTGPTHTVSGVSNNPTNVTVTFPSRSLSSLNHQVNEDSIVQPNAPQLDASPLNHTVIFTPVQGDIDVDATFGTRMLTAINHSVSSGAAPSFDNIDNITFVLGQAGSQQVQLNDAGNEVTEDVYFFAATDLPAGITVTDPGGPGSRLITIAYDGVAGVSTASGQLLATNGSYVKDHVPTIQDETDAYVLRSVNDPGLSLLEPIPGPYGDPVSSTLDLHNTTEADELETGLRQYIRHGDQPFLDHAQEWRTWFEVHGYGSTNWLNNPTQNPAQNENNNNLDHLYGWGLRHWIESQGPDAAALTALETIAKFAATNWDTNVQGSTPNNQYEATDRNGRRFGRLLRTVAATKEAGSTDSQVLADFDNYVDLALVTPSWTPDPFGNGGIYSLDDSPNGVDKDNRWGPGSYASGIRGIQAFHLGIVVEALMECWRVSKRNDVRQRIIDIAEWVNSYGYDPTMVGPNSGLSGMTGNNMGYNINTGVINHTANIVPDGVMTVSVINTMVYGYKFTGTTAWLDRAWFHWLRWHDHRIAQAGGTQDLHHRADSDFSGSARLRYNMGELQYCHALFENGGNPTLI